MAELIVENGPQGGTRVTLSADVPCAIGRGGDNQVVLDDPTAAPKHCLVKALKDKGFGIKALDGRLRVNGADVHAARLQDGDRIEVGTTRLRYAENAAAPGRDRTLGGFRLLDVLGRGGMGIVYRAEQMSLHREVALKVLSKELTSDPVFVARFVAEARAAARLSHPNVVQVFDVDRDGDTYFYSMELMAAGSLEARLRRDGRIPVDEALVLIRDAARGLHYAESLRIVHRDIKPDNLMLDQHGHVKIADLGLAQTDEEDTTKLVGTPHFMAPEQALRRPLDSRTDLYALGCTFYRLVTGRTPFQGQNSREILRAQVQETAEPAHKVEPSVPPQVGAIIEKLMAKDPAARYQSAAELIAELELVLTPPARRGIWIAAAAGAVVVAAAALFWALRDREPTIIEKTEFRTDPRAAALREEMRQKDAELARLSVENRGLEGLALAAALEAMVQEHPDTEAARVAAGRARELRADAERRAQAAAAREQAIRRLVQARTEAVGAALAERNYGAALQAIAAAVEPPALAAAPEVTQALAELRANVARAASGQLATLRTALGDATGARDEAAIRSARDALAAALERWPAELLPDADAIRQQLAAAATALDEIDAARRAAAEQAAWQSLGAAWAGPEGVLVAIAEWRFDAARAAAAAAVQPATGTPAEATARQLAAACTAAARHWAAFEAALAGGRLSFSTGENGPRPVVAFTPTGAEAGVVVRADARAKPERIPYGELGDSELLRLLLPPIEPPDPPARAAFVTLLALADELRAARGYLARVRTDEPQSGTGADAHASRRAWLAAAEDELSGCTAEWRQALAEELQAAGLLDRALRALSERRNQTAAGHLHRLLEAKPPRLLVLALR